MMDKGKWVHHNLRWVEYDVAHGERCGRTKDWASVLVDR